jgi:hypothetical protein
MAILMCKSWATTKPGEEGHTNCCGVCVNWDPDQGVCKDHDGINSWAQSNKWEDNNERSSESIK